MNEEKTAEIALYCDNCGSEIYEGSEFYTVSTPKGDFNLCRDCVRWREGEIINYE